MLCAKKDCGWSTIHYTNFHSANKKHTTTFCLPYTPPYMKSLNKSGEAPSDMTPASLTSGIFSTVSTNTSTQTNSSANDDVLYIKLSLALTVLI